MSRNRSQTVTPEISDEPTSTPTPDPTTAPSATENGNSAATDATQTVEDAAKAEAKAKADAEAAAELDFITGGAMTLSPELARISQPQRERSPKQMAMDAVAKSNHDHWVSVGRPSVWGTMVETKSVTTYFVDPEKAADTKKLITKAAALLGATVRWGSSFQATEAMRAKYGLPENYVGREVISFVVKDKRPRATSAVTSTNGNQSDNDDNADDDNSEIASPVAESTSD
jgi:hypothetical protein